MFRYLLLALAITASSSLACHAARADTLFRWIDEDGLVHFGDRPPAGAAAEDMTAAILPINSADAARPAISSQQRKAARDLERQYLNRQHQQQQQQQQQRAQRAHACREARHNLNILRGPVIVLDQDGQEVRLTERGRQQWAEEQEKLVQKYCD
ncbi:hypothetical protein Maes01_01884 [Microbulbifer aestuariivivens]|uniref:DUF4124 domain-containing protein n=1 Tax=Microbulbifer aestuariivivens TaxID=1908308 RepID=A0ABP9WQ42_9GAMM